MAQKEMGERERESEKRTRGKKLLLQIITRTECERVAKTQAAENHKQ